MLSNAVAGHQLNLWPGYKFSLILLLSRHFLKGVQIKFAVLVVRFAQQTAELIQIPRILA